MHTAIIAFTCDDVAPTTKAAKLRELLSTINRFDIKATFFVIPKSSSQWNSHSPIASALRDAIRDDHEIGLHGFRHSLFETWSPLGSLYPSHVEIKDKLAIGLQILNERLGTDPKGFRAPYYRVSGNLLKALDDLSFLYDSSKIALTRALLSYVIPLRVVWASGRHRLTASKVFHPTNLRLWEIPVTQEFTWHNMKFEARRFRKLLQRNVREIEPGFIVLNSHVETLSEGGLEILRNLFLFAREKGLTSLTLKQIAERHASLNMAEVYA